MLSVVQVRLLCGDKLEVPGYRPIDGAKRDRRVEGGELPLVRYRECEQIDVRELTMTLDVIPSKASIFSHADRVRPKDVLALGAEGSQSGGRIFDCGAGARVGGVREHAHECVFRKRTSRPSMPTTSSEPGVSRFVMHMGRIEQGYQYVHIQKCDHLAPMPRPGVDSRSPA